MTKQEAVLFNLDDFLSRAPIREERTKGHVWTENKAKLIARYLRSFTYVTKHGTYLDAFAGAQQGGNPKPDSWAAKLALENEPKWMKRFVLFELVDEKVRELEQLSSIHQVPSGKLRRSVSVIGGDSNLTLPAYLAGNPISEKEASFCLLDQRTKECKWSLVQTIANHKRSGRKIELFYFLAQGWVDRILTDKIGGKHMAKVIEWLGHDDWKSFKAMDSRARGLNFSERFKSELGYKFAKPFPIFKRGSEGKIMFWMIHASDHERAIPLMETAYTGVGLGSPEPNEEQLELLAFEHCTPPDQ